MSSLRFLFGAFIFLLGFGVSAQSFPVTVVVQSLPPFSTQISEWADPINSALGVSLLLNDRNEGNYQVRLKLTIEGNGVRLQTSNDWLPTPISLNYGQVLQLGGIELGEYLNLDRLSFAGYSRQAYIENGGLPDGAYTICVRAFDYNRSLEEAASDRACTFAQASLLDPPVVLSPVGQQQPFPLQSLIVQWQARHTASFMTDYRMEIYQIDPVNNFTPEQIYTFQQPFLEAQVDGLTTILVDASFPMLETGYEYMVRVQARDPLGTTSFRNDGYSEPMFFTYGSDCPPPSGLTGTVNGIDRAMINWAPESGVASYVVRFREKRPDANWYERTAVFNDARLTELLEGTTYEVQVQSVCSNGGAGLFGQVYEFTTEGVPADPVDCGAPINTIPRPTNTVNIPTLAFGQDVTVGGFTMRVKSVAPTATGGWKGVGQIRIPWLYKTINCQFNNLFVNTDRVVYDGNVVAVDEGLSSLNGFLTVDEIVALADTLPLNFCGDSTALVDAPADLAYSNQDFYASGNPEYNNHYIPFDPNSPGNTGGTVVDDEQFYNQYNPNNSRARYSPTDYGNPNSPYTEEQPYDPSNIWNPWNAFNAYNYLDYDDPANPWTADFIWTVEQMFAKQSVLGTAYDPSLFADGVSLPVTLGSSPNMLAIYGIKFTPTGAFLNAYFSASIPSVGQNTAFQAIGVGFGPTGLQGETKLKMLADLTFSWSSKMKLTINSGNSTYVQFDCAGVNQVAIDMKVEVCRDVAVPVDPITYVRDENSYVTGTFSAVAGGWGEFAGDITITPFELSQLPGWAFAVQNAVFDFSSTSTPASVQFPSGYLHADVTNNSDPALRTGLQNPGWRGFYLGGARIRIPDKLTGKKANEAPVTIGAQHLIIDQTGFSGDIFAVNLLSIDSGRLDSWAIGIDTIALGIQQNTFHHMRLAGALQVPAIDPTLTYKCHIQPGSRYAFSLAIRDSSLTMSAMVAEIRLDPNTEIGIDYRVSDQSFAASATLYGQITFNPGLGGGDQGGAAGAGGTGDAEPADSNNKLSVPYIAFTNFSLSSRAPYITSVGSWEISTGSNGQSSASGFPLTLNQVGLFQNEAQNEVAFGIDLSLNLVKSSDQGFAANGRAYIICDVSINAATNRQEWSFKRVRLDKLSIDYRGSGFRFAGYIRNYESHPVYGTGFQGGIQASFTPGIRVAVAAMFGTVKDQATNEDFRYFFADALLGLDPGIILGATGVALYGFGGGISYHMERLSFQAITLPYSEGEESGDPPAEYTVTGGTSDLASAFEMGDPVAGIPDFLELPSELGQSLSGARYIPNKRVGIGIKAMIAFGAVRREVFNGDITFEIIFNEGGGLHYIGLMGNANMLTPPRTPLTPNPQPSVAFFVDMGFNFDESTFDAYLRLQVSLPPGIGFVRGSYANNVAGEGQIHFGPDDWFFYLGTPSTPVSLSLDISQLANMARDDGNGDASLPPDNSSLLDSNSVKQPLGQIETIGLIMTTYLCAGTILPEFPDLPPEVAEILQDPSYRGSVARDDPAFASADGLLFGAGLQINMPRLKFLIFYAELYAGAGFDMMLKDYGLNARCANDLTNPNPIGFSGWYATGQLYGYLQGNMGIEINIGLLNINIEIMQVAAAAVVQARLPNPLWARGAVAGRFSVLNGLIKGNVKFDFEAGQQCDIVPTGSLDISIVQSITPADTVEESSVFVRPQTIFNFKMNEGTLVLPQSDEYVEIKPVLQYMRVTDEETGATIPGTLTWDDTKTIAAFLPTDILPPFRTYRTSVKVQVMQRESPNEAFRLIDLGGNIPPTQDTSFLFKTGPAPDYIPEDNVAFAYPIDRQLNFLVDESDQGYIQLLQGQDYLFNDNVSATEWSQKIRFQQQEAVVNVADYVYDDGANRLAFAIPSGELARSTVSALELIDFPVGPDAAVGSNVDAVDAVLLDLTDGDAPDSTETQVLLATQEANGEIIGRKAHLVYRLDFRTSGYGSFAEKMAEVSREFTFVDIQALTEPTDAAGNNVPFLSIDDFGEIVTSSEVFDRYELNGFSEGSKDLDPLIQARANLDMTQNDWFNTHLRPNVYDSFPAPGPPYHFDLEWRPDTLYGLPPTKAVSLRQNANAPLLHLTDFDVRTRTFFGTPRPLQLRYHVPFVTYRDYADYWNQLMLYLRDNEGTPGQQTFSTWDYIYPDYGTYEMTLDYVLPGKTSPNSTFRYQLPYAVLNQGK
jgi:hypothetical protein